MDTYIGPGGEAPPLRFCVSAAGILRGHSRLPGHE